MYRSAPNDWEFIGGAAVVRRSRDTNETTASTDAMRRWRPRGLRSLFRSSATSMVEIRREHVRTAPTTSRQLHELRHRRHRGCRRGRILQLQRRPACRDRQRRCANPTQNRTDSGDVDVQISDGRVGTANFRNRWMAVPRSVTPRRWQPQAPATSARQPTLSRAQANLVGPGAVPGAVGDVQHRRCLRHRPVCGSTPQAKSGR